MIKHICVCSICDGEESFDSDNRGMPYGWHSVYGLIDDTYKDVEHICPSCWQELRYHAGQIRAREVYH